MVLTSLYKIRKIVAIISVMVVSCVSLVGCQTQEVVERETVQYEGEEYVLLDYPTNVFYYDYNGNSHDNFEEVDGIYPLDSPKWDMVWNGGDLCCIEEKMDEANRYYADDKNYEWYVVIDEEDEEFYYPIDVTESELQVVYGIDEVERTTAVFMEEFEGHGSLIKISKDGIMRGIITIAKYDGKWQWRSEVIDESREKDDTWPEYIQPLPETLDQKIKEAEK